MKKKAEYAVEFVNGVFNGDSTTLVEMLKSITGSDRPRIAIVADMNVVHRNPELGRMIGSYVNTHNIDIVGSPVVIGGGEKIKADGMHSAMTVINSLLNAKIGTNDCIVQIGGGSLFDVAGWVAAQIRGGVRSIRIPTTPAAMCDSGFSETVAIDSATIKDALQINYQPSGVIVDTDYAQTVLDGVWRGGYSSALRIGLTTDALFVKKLAKLAEDFSKRDQNALVETVNSCWGIRTKKALLPNSLWSAKRLEAMSGYKLPHGYAIAIGIMIDCNYSVLKGWMPEEERDFVRSILADCGAIDGASHSRHLLNQSDVILQGLDAWKLNTGSEAIVVPAGLGKARIEEVPDRDAMKSAIDLVK